jgi:hypothetical protein
MAEDSFAMKLTEDEGPEPDHIEDCYLVQNEFIEHLNCLRSYREFNKDVETEMKEFFNT